MAPGKKRDIKIDVLTAWELAAINLLISINPQIELDVQASQEIMLALMKALDSGDLDIALADPDFMAATEALLLALLQGKYIEVSDTTTFAAQKELFAAAQVIYNMAVARGFRELHPQIRDAMQH